MLTVTYRIEFIDKRLDDAPTMICVDSGNAPQRVAEALAQGLREYGDFEDVKLTRIEHVEKPVGF